MSLSLDIAHWIVIAVALQRLAESAYANRNARRLIAQGGQEAGAAHYPLFIVLHAAWLVALFAGAARETPVDWPLIGVFGLLQIARLWVIATLGPYWTTRVITLPEAPLVAKGPYKFLRHPNYLIVTAEIAVLPLAFGAWITAGVFTVLNAALLFHRIRVEDGALAERRHGTQRRQLSL